jgi:hypothetical protein
MSDKNYAHPEALVSTEWAEAHLADPHVRIVESNEDILLYDTGHIQGAVHIDWRSDLQDQTIRDYITPQQFSALCERNGISNDTTVIFYGDKSNWWACYALWVFRLFGHTKSWTVGATSGLPRGGISREPCRTSRMATTSHSRPAAIRKSVRFTIRPSPRAVLAWRSSMCGRQRNSVVRSLTCRSIPRKAFCAAVTSPVRPVFPGRWL